MKREPTFTNQALKSGAKLGAYEIVAFLGAGGMGEVYRAHDVKLDRDIALKILPAEFTNHPDRLARFRREARMLAALNDPNIAAIYGLEQSGDTHYLCDGASRWPDTGHAIEFKRAQRPRFA